MALLQNSVLEPYRYREVLYNLLGRDLKIKYKRTYFGYLWSLLNPLLQLLVLSLVFSHVVRIEMHHYTLFLFSGLLAWSFFQTSCLMASTSFLENESFIKKIYLPKILFPLSKVSFRLIDLGFSLVAFSLIGVVLGFPIHASVAALPLAILLLLFFSLGVAISCAVLTVYFRDFQYLLTVFLQLLYFATPILYPIERLPENYHRWMELNPLYGVLHLFQIILHEGRFPMVIEWGIGGAFAFLSLFFGLFLLDFVNDELIFRL